MRERTKAILLNEALESAPGTFIRKINKTSVVFETHGHYEKVTLHPGLPDIIKQPDSENQNVLADYIIATPIRDGEQIYGLRLNPRKVPMHLPPACCNTGISPSGSIIFADPP